VAPKKNEVEWFQQDELIRNYIFSHFPETVSVEIERTETELTVYIYTSNSSLINEKNENSLNQTLARLINNKKLIIKTYFKLDQDSAQALASSLARQLENNIN
jgi:ribosomal protein S3